jgi:GTPase SAR1 family protein
MSYQLLILGGPHVGKTHYVGQLYLRLTDRQRAPQYALQMAAPPTDLTAINHIIERLREGRSAEHTPSGFNEEISFTVTNRQGQEVVLTFPDYAGEQVQRIVSQYQIPPRWQEMITHADEWLLFIRPDEIKPIEDVTNRSRSHLIEQRPRAKAALAKGELSDPAFYIELLQMLRYTRGQSALVPALKPRLTVALTCWDTLPNIVTAPRPTDQLRSYLPFLADFLAATWEPAALRILGLSSTEITLDPNTPNEDFVDGPEQKGYVVLADGTHSPDLTLLIAS